MSRNSYLNYLLLLIVGMLLASFTMVFGTIPMRVIRKSYGRRLFWLGHLTVAISLLVIGLIPFAASVLILTVLVGTYSEVEEHGSGLFISGLISILATLGLTVLSGTIWLQRSSINLTAFLEQEVSNVLTQISASRASVPAVEVVMGQLPSVLVILFIVSLATALIWERQVRQWFRLKSEEALGNQLLMFRVPDVCVWIAMAAVLGAVLQHGRPWLETLSVNALNVLAMLYFFQGLAVITLFFKVYKVHIFWQAFWYLVLVIQLFPLVGLVGFVDYWLDFRERLLKKSAETKNSL